MLNIAPNSVLNFALLGAGRIGKIHAANLARHPRAKLTVIADVNAAAADELAQTHQCAGTTDCFAAIERSDVDVVLIGTPTNTHVDFLLHAVALGKPILCEKPIDLDIERARMAVAEIEKHNATVMLAFNRRYDPDALALKQAILAGEIGDIRQIFLTARDPGLAPRSYLEHCGGIFRDMTIHDFDTARWLLGEEPSEIWAMGDCLIDPTLTELKDFDTVMVMMRTTSGKQCHINGCHEAVYGFDQRVEVFGSKGMLINDNHRQSTIRRWDSRVTDAREPLLNFFLERHADSYRLEIDAFINALIARAPMPITPRDGLQALLIANCAFESVNTGKRVMIT